MRNTLTWLWFVPFMLLTVWLGARGLNAHTLWYDEHWSVYLAGGAHYGPLSASDLWNRNAQEDAWHPPGYYFLLAGWGAVVGWTAYAGRVLSLLFGVLATAWTYRLGRVFASPTAGLGAAVAIGASAFFVNYLYELRDYTLFALLSALTAWAYWQIINTTTFSPKVAARFAPSKHEVLFMLGVAGLLYTHYFASLTVIALGIYHLLFVPKNRLWWRVPILMGVAALTFLPWLGVTLNLVTNVSAIDPMRSYFSLDPLDVVRSVLGMFSNSAVALFAFLALCSLFAGVGRRVLVFVWVWALGVLILSLVFNQWLKILTHIRYMMGMWSALALIAGIGIDRLARRGIHPALALGVWVAACLWNTFDPAAYQVMRPPHIHLPWDRLATALAPRAASRDVIVFLLPYPASYKMHKPVMDYYTHGLRGRYRLLESPRFDTERYNVESMSYAHERQRLWVAYDPAQEPSYLGSFEDVIEASRVHCATIADSPELRLDLYALRPSAPALDSAPRFGDGIRLTLLHPLTMIGGKTLNILIDWGIDASIPPDTFSAGLHVETADGQLLAQTDYGLPAQSGCQSADIDIGALPPGEYTLRAAVYNWATGERLPTEDGDRAVLTTFKTK